jgi:hypothetical protein
MDIPFKGSQSHSNMRSKVTALSNLHSGVNDTAVHVTAVSLIPVLWIRIRIRKDPKRFAGSGSGSVTRGYGSGSRFGSETGLKSY